LLVRVILTADNSRSEDTSAIIASVKSGFDHADSKIATDLVIEADRSVAIGLAIAGAKAADVVILAGKGHEKTQTVGEVITAFDDVAVARDHLGRAGYRAAS